MIMQRLTLGAAALAVSLSITPGGVLAADDDPVVATVNGTKILKSMLVTAQQLLPEQYQKIPLMQFYPALVDTVIDMKLSAADARKKRLHETKEFKVLMSRVEDQMLQRTVLQAEVDKALTEEALKRRYDALIADEKSSTEVHARHILVKTKEEANDIIEQLQNGASFEVTAKERSTGPSATSGGDLGFFGKGQMVPEFEKAAFSLRKGKFTDTPVKTQFGWHIIKLEDRRKSEPPSFESIKQKLQTEISQETGAEYVSGLRKEAKIERFDLDGKPLPK
ncbi:MAG: peptidylprolyl isomerase [Magnetovibrio sp.]|nr:peptidylprolyl isomerase [Magnetovibrio sp.]